MSLILNVSYVAIVKENCASVMGTISMINWRMSLILCLDNFAADQLSNTCSNCTGDYLPHDLPRVVDDDYYLSKRNLWKIFNARYNDNVFIYIVASHAS